MKKKKKKGHGKLIAFIVLLVIVATIVALIVFLPKDKNPNAVMECSVNPDVQFVLNKNNQVIQVNYLNSDAELLLCNQDFYGKSAEDVAKSFVRLSTEAGYIDVSTTGTTVEITISCKENSNFEELKEKVTKKVNEYFDENGIIAGALTTIKTGFNEAIQKIGVKANEIAELTEDEVLELLNETSEKINGIALSLHNSLFEFIEQLKNSEAFKNLPKLEEYIDQLTDQINDSQIPEDIKKSFEEKLETLKTQLTELKNELNAEIDKKIEELKELSQEIYNRAKEQLQQKVQQAKQLREQHRNYFEKNKEAVKNAIQAYRDTLASA